MGMRSSITSASHPIDIGVTERVNHTVAQPLSMVVNGCQIMTGTSNCPRVEEGFKNSVDAVTALAPNEVQMGKSPRLLITIIKRLGGCVH